MIVVEYIQKLKQKTAHQKFAAHYTFIYSLNHIDSIFCKYGREKKSSEKVGLVI